MGDPKFSRRKYDTPSHPWQGTRIKEENELLKKYGLKNKRELWKAQSTLRNYRGQARDLLARLRYGDVHAEMEMKDLLAKLANLGLLPDNATLDDVLALELEKLLERRLQTQVYLKGLAFTPNQARQLIVHGHANIGERKVTVPGYLVKRNEEGRIAYNPYSPLAHELHPARPTPEHAERSTREFFTPKPSEKEKEGRFKRKVTLVRKEESKTPDKAPATVKAEPGKSTTKNREKKEKQEGTKAEGEA
ncbi:MAG: 30S ribosomal protein S4 [Thermoplasmata archaeon]|nr:MAG: 30S ribosomal protein S4 [Thermoplasmata archaeon]